MSETIKKQTDEKVAGLIDALREKKLTVGTAESCTAGMISARIADIPGSSDVLLGGIVSYSNDVKMKLLGVSGRTLREHGAVSEQCAREMAEGARRLFGADVAVSVTGVAGPGGGSAEKPVGLVWFGLASPDGVKTESRVFQGDRAAVRAAAVEHALELLLAAVEG